MVALRVVPELLGKTARVTEAEAVPEDEAETVIQPGTPETAHGHEAALWTLTAKLPPEAGNCNAVGETEYVQEGGVKIRMFPV
jgi:hypothetical protein